MASYESAKIHQHRVHLQTDERFNYKIQSAYKIVYTLYKIVDEEYCTLETFMMKADILYDHKRIWEGYVRYTLV